MINSYQIRAARALIGWSLKDLEEACGVSGQSISNYEVERSRLNATNLERVVNALQTAGVEFTKTGVQLKTTPLYYHEGADWYLRLLDDVYNTLVDVEGAVLRIENVDDKKSSQEVIQKLRKIRDCGISMRMMAMEGETCLLAPSDCYRFIPDRFFKNWVVLIFGNKVAFSIENEKRCLVVEDADMAKAMANRFDLTWDMLSEIKVQSTAHERI